MHGMMISQNLDIRVGIRPRNLGTPAQGPSRALSESVLSRSMPVLLPVGTIRVAVLEAASVNTKLWFGFTDTAHWRLPGDG